MKQAAKEHEDEDKNFAKSRKDESSRWFNLFDQETA